MARRWLVHQLQPRSQVLVLVKLVELATFVTTCADVMGDKAGLNKILGDFLLANLGAGYTKIIAYVSQTCAEVETGRRARRAVEAVVTTSVGFSEAEGSTEDDAEAAATTIVAAATSPEASNQLVYTINGVTSNVGAVSVAKVTVADIISEDPARDAKIVGDVVVPAPSADVVVAGTTGKAKKGKKGKGAKTSATTVAKASKTPSTAANNAAASSGGKTGKKEGKKDGKGHDHAEHGHAHELRASAANKVSPSMNVVGVLAGVVAAVVVAVGVMISRAKDSAKVADESGATSFEIVVEDNGITEHTPLVEAAPLILQI